MRTAVLLTVATLQAVAGSAQQLEIYHIDVDQGEPMLVVAPTGESFGPRAGVEEWTSPRP